MAKRELKVFGYVASAFGASRDRCCLRPTRVLLIPGLLSLLAPMVAFGAALKGVQSGTATLPNGSASVSVAISSVTTSQAFLVFNLSGSDLNPANLQVSGQITDATHLTFARAGTTGAVSIRWHVAEFTSGVTVQRGSYTFPNTTTNKAIVTIAAVDLTRSFPIISYLKAGTTFGDDDFANATFYSATQLQLSLYTGGVLPATIEWQVVTYDSCTVQSGSVSFAAGDASKTAAVTSSSPARSWLMYNYISAIGTVSNIGQKLIQGVVTSPTLLTFTRSSTGQAMTLNWFLVTFEDTTLVQQGAQAFTSAETQKDVTLSTSVSSSCSIAVAGGESFRGGSSADTTDGNAGAGWATTALTSGTTLRITRGYTGSAAASIPWWVIEFPPCAPTAVDSVSFKAEAYRSGTLLRWRTGYEVDNLGFYLYRDAGDGRILLTPRLLAGSALLAGPATAMTAGNSYTWWDANSKGHQEDVTYWLQEVDLDGTRTWHGPYPARPAGDAPPSFEQSLLLAQTGRSGCSVRGYAALPSAAAPAAETVEAEASRVSTASSFIKILVRQDGWYRLTQPELLAAGLDPSVKPQRLKLFAEGKQIPMVVTGREDGRFGPSDAIEFYGTRLDTPWTDARAYLLQESRGRGRRVHLSKAKDKATATETSFPYTVERRDRTVYFAALHNGRTDNWFGPPVTSDVLAQVMALPHVDARSSDASLLEVSLQGVTVDPDHSPNHLVQVSLNGSVLGELVFDGQASAVKRFEFPTSLLSEGDNVVSLSAAGANTDVSLVDAIRITYPHTFAADGDALEFVAAGGQSSMVVGGFSTPEIRVVDVTDPDAVSELASVTAASQGGYSARFFVKGQGPRRLYAFGQDRVLQPAEVALQTPRDWKSPDNGADEVMITRRDFAASLEPLKALRESQGLSVAVVDVEDLYDEFNHGEKSPWAIRDFLAYAESHWRNGPRYVLLAGGASFDHRNYLGFGDLDFVPSMDVVTKVLTTESDDWFADFDDDGIPSAAVGRLPVRTATEAGEIVAKIVGYEQSPPGGAWSHQVLFVADQNGGFDFEGETAAVRTLVPPDLSVGTILSGQMDPQTARYQILQGMEDGQLVVNYLGHGSSEAWGNQSLLTSASAQSLTNGGRLPFVVSMDCLNGLFQDLYTRCLGTSLLLNGNGGAVAVWASSGMTETSGQALLDQGLFRSLLAPASTRVIGDAVRSAKASVDDLDVRRTWILFGDPATRLAYGSP